MPQLREPEKTEIVERRATPSERFVAEVERQFIAEFGEVSFTPYERTLGQHLSIVIDTAMAEFNAKRSEKTPEIGWHNLNMRKLAVDAANRVGVGLDALIPGFIYPIPYYNAATEKYNLDLRVGYKGELFYKQQMSIHPIRKIRIELVYSTDEFTVYMADKDNKVEGYKFKINQPFDRGEVVGGFGYIVYEDETMNELIILSKAEIEKYHAKAQSQNFWGPWYQQMAYKTIVHRVAAKITPDPMKINTKALASVESEEQDALAITREPQRLIVGEPIVIDMEEASQADPTHVEPDQAPSHAQEDPF